MSYFLKNKVRLFGSYWFVVNKKSTQMALLMLKIADLCSKGTFSHNKCIIVYRSHCTPFGGDGIHRILCVRNMC